MSLRHDNLGDLAEILINDEIIEYITDEPGGYKLFLLNRDLRRHRLRFKHRCYWQRELIEMLRLQPMLLDEFVC